jgi:hypothetical protein
MRNEVPDQERTEVSKDDAYEAHARQPPPYGSEACPDMPSPSEVYHQAIAMGKYCAWSKAASGTRGRQTVVAAFDVKKMENDMMNAGIERTWEWVKGCMENIAAGRPVGDAQGLKEFQRWW